MYVCVRVCYSLAEHATKTTTTTATTTRGVCVCVCSCACTRPRTSVVNTHTGNIAHITSDKYHAHAMRNRIIMCASFVGELLRPACGCAHFENRYSFAVCTSISTTPTKTPGSHTVITMVVSENVLHTAIAPKFNGLHGQSPVAIGCFRVGADIGVDLCTL